MTTSENTTTISKANIASSSCLNDKTNFNHDDAEDGVKAPEPPQKHNCSNDNDSCNHDNAHDDYDCRSLIISTAEAMNPTKRTTMEDRFVIHPPGTWNAPDPNMSYVGVYDGHGGREMVDFLEHALTYHVAQELRCPEEEEEDHVDITIRLERAFLLTDIHARHAGIMTSGATVALCLIQKNPNDQNAVQLTTANVGDSRVVLWHAGQAERLSSDHKPDDPLEAARIERDGGFILKSRVLGVLAITRSLGDQMLKPYVIATPSVKQSQLELQDDHSESFLIVACDGLWDVLSDEEACALVCEFTGGKENVAQHLVEQALQRGTTDNVTAIVVWL